MWHSNLSKQASAVECSAARRCTLETVHNIVVRTFERDFSEYERRDKLVVEGILPEVRVLYVCKKLSRFDQRSCIDYRFHLDSRQIWIRSIQVATSHRRHGIGSQLVRVAEATANAMGIEEIRILPIPSSIDFWISLGYAPDPSSARVMWKDPANIPRMQKNRKSNGYSHQGICSSLS
jgi:GNAT superfamily N-acetyltransferase